MTKKTPILLLFAATVAWSGGVAHGNGSGPFDAAVANVDRLIELLKRTGELSQDAGRSEAVAAVDAYLRWRAEQAQLTENDLDADVWALRQRAAAISANKRLLHQATMPRLSESTSDGPEALQAPNDAGVTRVGNALAVLVEYADFPHNSIQPDETDMYFEDYTPAHYNDLIFSPDGYTGPKGETLISGQQYYLAQSGGSYLLTGIVSGWHQAEHPATYYGGNTNGRDGDPRALVAEAVLAAAADATIDWSSLDREDRFDLDGDGDFNEPDGIIDHLLVFHSSVGEEAGGGSLGEDAIWSHRWQLPSALPIPGTVSEVPYWGGTLVALGYTMQPGDAAAGVVVHEYGHDLGLPDEYDTGYTGQGEPVAYWSGMSSGSWAGLTPGTEPTGFSPYAREFLQAEYDGNWLVGATVNLDDIGARGTWAIVDEASSKGRHLDYLRIDLPNKETVITTPSSGEYLYFSGSGNNLNNAMTVTVDLTRAAESTILRFNAWYDIEQDWDHAYVWVDDGLTRESIPGNVTTAENPYGTNLGYGITGQSEVWVPAEFDLSGYAGSVVQVQIEYVTDGYVANPGLYIDDVALLVDGEVALADDVEGEPEFALTGFSVGDGLLRTPHHYLLEWRTHNGVDSGLGHIRRGEDQIMSYNTGLLVWYVDAAFDNNWVGDHPGDGFVGVVDADQKPLRWSDDDTVAGTRYQVRDAAFSWRPSYPLILRFGEGDERRWLLDFHVWPRPRFRDDRSYMHPDAPDAGRKITAYGLRIGVAMPSWDGRSALLRLSRRSYNR